MTNEVIINGVENEISNPESLLDSALDAIKTSKSQIFKDEELEKEQEPIQEPERETLKLPERSNDEFKKDSKFVETDNPEVQQRINELYKKQRTAEETNALLRDELLRLTENFEQKEGYLQSQLQQVQNRFNQQDENLVLTQLRNQYKEAIENFEYDKAQEINEKIVDFKTEQKLQLLLDKQKIVPEIKQQQPKKQPTFADPKDVIEADKLTSERTETGDLKRPWLQPNHPQFDDVVDMMAAISNKYIRKNQRPYLPTIVEEVEKFMGLGQNKGTLQNTLRHAPVLSSNAILNAGSDNQANKLSDLERSYAAKLGVSEKDYARMRKISSSGPISLDNFK